MAFEPYLLRMKNLQGQSLVCIETFAFIEAGTKYYCVWENDDFFYIWSREQIFGMNEFKISKKYISIPETNTSG